MKWADSTPRTPLTDAQIVAIGLRTMRRYRPAFGITVSSHLTAAKLGRLAGRRAS